MPNSQRLAVIVSQGASHHPEKRQLEEDLVARLLLVAGIEVTVIPHLYDLSPESTGMLALQSMKGDMIVCSWLFERAAHCVLDQNGIHGQRGTVLLSGDSGDSGEPEGENRTNGQRDATEPTSPPNGASRSEIRLSSPESRERSDRKIYCLDFKTADSPDDLIDEIQRIQTERSIPLVTLGDQTRPASVQRIEKTGGRRWYPVIDYSRCTNCMECIDFCLFGVYGVDRIDTILVEAPDNCRKGCPACSRVCPENAIIFPQHKEPAIAGSSGVVESLKIDLSKLFGAPAENKTASELAAEERNEQLIAAGRAPVASPPANSSAPHRTAPTEPDASDQKHDELDDLVNELNDLEL